MLTDNCKSCVYCRWLVGVGLGVRCNHEENQKYKNVDDKHKELPVIISNIPENCTFYLSKNNI